MAAMLGVARGMPWGWGLEDWLHGGERRRRCRTRERDAWARELRRDAFRMPHDPYCLDELSACYDGMCECDCHGDQDWKRGGENAMILELMARADGVPFDGTYTVGP